MTPAIEIRDVEKRFGPARAPARAIDGVSLAIPRGAVMGIVGESGCGKSTLARIVLGLLPPTAGTVRVDGHDLAALDRKARARLIQPIFQDPYGSLNPRHRIRDIVALPLRAQGTRNPEKPVLDILARVGLDPALANRLPAELSGGQRQRVAIARALVLRPRIVICDEPTSALDVSVQAQILNLLADLRRDLDLTLVFISHNLAVVEHIATEVAVMYLGRIVEHAPVQDLFQTPCHPYTKALLASVLTPEPGLGIPTSGLGDTPPDPANIPTGCRLHPRCPVAEPRCTTQSPNGRTRNGRLVECLLTTDG
jgi:peptide/nickel transport system ATP-binding protein